MLSLQKKMACFQLQLPVISPLMAFFPASARFFFIQAALTVDNKRCNREANTRLETSCSDPCVAGWFGRFSIFCCPRVAVLDNAEGEWDQQNTISDSNLNWSDCFNGPLLAHYTRLQPTVLLRNIRANRNVSNKAAWLGDGKKRGSWVSLQKKKQKRKNEKKLLIRIVLPIVP